MKTGNSPSGVDRDGATGVDVRAPERHAAAAGARGGRHRGPAAHRAGVPLPQGEAAGYGLTRLSNRARNIQTRVLCFMVAPCYQYTRGAKTHSNHCV